jgi:hypothetical protein
MKEILDDVEGDDKLDTYIRSCWGTDIDWPATNLTE